MPLPLRCEPPHVSDEAMLLFNAPACRLSAFEVWNTCDGGGESTLHMHAEVFLAGGFPLFPFFGEKTAEFQNFLSNYIVGNEALLLKVTHNSLLRQTVSAKLKLKWFVMGGGGVLGVQVDPSRAVEAANLGVHGAAAMAPVAEGEQRAWRMKDGA